MLPQFLYTGTINNHIYDAHDVFTGLTSVQGLSRNKVTVLEIRKT